MDCGGRRRAPLALFLLTLHPQTATCPPPAEKSEVWIVEDGEVHPWDGDFEDYKDELVREIAAELDEQVRMQTSQSWFWILCWG